MIDELCARGQCAGEVQDSRQGRGPPAVGTLYIEQSRTYTYVQGKPWGINIVVSRRDLEH